MQWAVIVVAALAVAAFAYTLLSFFVSEESVVKRRLKHLSDYERSEAGHAEPLLEPFAKRVIKPASAQLAYAARLFGPGDYAERTRVRLRLAGNPHGLEAEGFMAVKALLTIAAAGPLFFLGLAVSASTGRLLFGLIIVAAIAFYLPDIWLRSKISERKLAIRRTLPDMLDMLTISVEAGMGFDAAVAKVVSSRKGPLSEEFGRMLQEVQAGVSRREALKHLSERTQVPELNTFIMSIVQAEVFGVSVSKVLRTQSHEMRVKRRQFAEEMAQKAPVKIVFPLVLCILPATIIIIAGPAIIAIGRAFGMMGQ